MKPGTKLFVSNQEESHRIFKSNFIEFFTWVHWTLPLWVYLPVIGYCLTITVSAAVLSPLEMFAYFSLAVFFWTFAEYMLHRFVFHFHPKSQWGQTLMWFLHGIHHDYPSDALRLVMPPPISIPLAILFYALFVAVLGEHIAPVFMAGFILGYLVYDISHYAIHHFPIKGNLWGKLREHHLRHHFKAPDKGYGVSSPLWDKVFGTELEPLKSQETAR